MPTVRAQPACHRDWLPAIGPCSSAKPGFSQPLGAGGWQGARLPLPVAVRCRAGWPLWAKEGAEVRARSAHSHCCRASAEAHCLHARQTALLAAQRTWPDAGGLQREALLAAAGIRLQPASYSASAAPSSHLQVSQVTELAGAAGDRASQAKPAMAVAWLRARSGLALSLIHI